VRREHAVIVLAGGRSAEQRDGPDLALLPLAGRRLVSRALASLTDNTDVVHAVVAVHANDRSAIADVLDREVPDLSYELVSAELSSQQTISAAVEALARSIDDEQYELVLIHDAALPLVPPHLVREVIAAARRWGSAVPYLGIDDFVWMDRMGAALRFSGNDGRIQVQMPQAFRADELLHAYRRSAAEGFVAGSATEAVERYCGRRVRGVPGDTRNVEVRTPRDLFAAEGLLAALHYVVS
jgi:2-C-methyl-D-erythritol 4-phosphate cytidylyltransferase